MSDLDKRVYCIVDLRFDLDKKVGDRYVLYNEYPVGSIVEIMSKEWKTLAIGIVKESEGIYSVALIEELIPINILGVAVQQLKQELRDTAGETFATFGAWLLDAYFKVQEWRMR